MDRIKIKYILPNQPYFELFEKSVKQVSVAGVNNFSVHLQSVLNGSVLLNFDVSLQCNLL